MQRLIVILIADLMAIASFYAPLKHQLPPAEAHKLRQINRCLKLLKHENRHIHRHVHHTHHHV